MFIAIAHRFDRITLIYRYIFLYLTQVKQKQQQQREEGSKNSTHQIFIKLWKKLQKTL